MIDTRFQTALQMVLSVAVAEESGLRRTSADLAESLGSNPSFVRKLLLPLNQDGILVSSPGKAGGIRLGRCPEEITLCDIYRAVVPDKKLWAARDDLPGNCLVSANIAMFFGGVVDQAEIAVIDFLRRTTIADSVAELHHLERRRLAAQQAAFCGDAAAAEALEPFAKP